MKPKASFCLRRMPDGEVIGQVIDEHGFVVETRNFGKFSVEEFEKCSAVLNLAMPDLHLQPIDVTVSDN
ncbi:MAG: hypothetical protein M0Z67_06285 [Nitrospiraceae bacterium]|nr:hypothetical protein [Nitrospiraceae bacterium]